MPASGGIGRRPGWDAEVVRANKRYLNSVLGLLALCLASCGGSVQHERWLEYAEDRGVDPDSADDEGLREQVRGDMCPEAGRSGATTAAFFNEGREEAANYAAITVAAYGPHVFADYVDGVRTGHGAVRGNPAFARELADWFKANELS